MTKSRRWGSISQPPEAAIDTILGHLGAVEAAAGSGNRAPGRHALIVGACGPTGETLLSTLLAGSDYVCVTALTRCCCPPRRLAAFLLRQGHGLMPEAYHPPSSKEVAAVASRVLLETRTGIAIVDADLVRTGARAGRHS